MSRRTLITGATGKVGTHLTQLLQARALPLRVGIHSAEKGAALAGPDTEAVPLDFDDPASIAAAVEGIDTIVLLTPPDPRQVDWAIRVIDLAKAAGVRRIVRMSVIAAAMEPGITIGRWHRTVERYLQASGLDHTIVRPGPFMQNFLGMYPRTGGDFALPVGDARVTHIHVRDVARALAAVTSGEGHDGKIYMLTGAEPLTFAQSVATLAAASGDTSTYEAISMARAQDAFVEQLPAWFAGVLLELFAAFSTGAVGLTTSTFQDLTGHPPIAFETFAAEVAARKAA